MILSIGGDGTILHVANLTLSYHKPILGINLDAAVFWPPARWTRWRPSSPPWRGDSNSLDNRMLLYVRVLGDPTGRAMPSTMLLSPRGRLQQAIDFSVYCDNILVEHFRGDGVIVATPTGSTAYSLAAGGPHPGFPDQGHRWSPPSAPTAWLPPPMVFAQERKISIGVGQVQDDEVFISCDGDSGYPLLAGATAVVRLSDQVIQLITFRPGRPVPGHRPEAEKQKVKPISTPAHNEKEAAIP